MQSLEIQGLYRVVKALEATPDVIRQARAEVMEEMGQELLSDVQRRIGGNGRVAGVQEYRVGSGKGYVAVRAKSDTELDGYAAGYVTNALEGGHPVRQSSGSAKQKRQSRAKTDAVPGKYMYRDVRETRAELFAQVGAKRIEDAAVKHLNSLESAAVSRKNPDEIWRQQAIAAGKRAMFSGKKSWEK